MGIETAIAGSALLGAGASLYGANKQAKAAENAARMSMDQYTQSRADLMPWADTGRSANSKLAQYLGIGNGVSVDDQAYKSLYDSMVANLDKAHQAKYGMSIWDPRADAASRASQLEQIRQKAMTQASAQAQKPAEYGSLLKPFTGEDLTSEPGYQFGLSEGEKAINRMALANGGVNNGATMKALLRFNEDYAGTKYNDAYNRDASNKNRIYSFLSGTSGAGENAAGQTANLGASAANAAGNFGVSAGDANAAGVVGATNALTSGLGSYLQYGQNQSMLKYLQGLRTGGISNQAAWNTSGIVPSGFEAGGY